MAQDMGRDRDLVLAPGEFAFVLDTTKGLVNTIAGPNKVSMSNTDQPVIFDGTRFVRVEQKDAVQLNAIAPEGFYIALYNPEKADKHPVPGSQSSGSAELQVGHRVNVQGPANFALWPGQKAETISGHHLRSNQYVLIQVYNDAAATANWNQAVVKPAAGDGKPEAVVTPQTFTPGQLLVIKGTDVAFFMPPTGIKVVKDSNGGFIREAVTLERLEYCILLDENGTKRFVQGPNVVFPKPTETFVEKDSQRKFRAIELNETSGLYIKIIADYTDGNKQYKAGEELFITGKEQAIYFQREEQSIIRYGEQTKHYAVAVPAGEGRYVLDRVTGEIALRKGPLMLLCDPRREVIVRRVLTEDQVKLWYPGNVKALQINNELAVTELPTGSPSQYEAGRTAVSANFASAGSAGLTALYHADEQALRSRQVAGDVFNRGQKFTPPRTVTLDTKYEGAVGLSIWTGYAVMVTNKRGSRRVVLGPSDVLLEYDETLSPVELSTGVPKTDTKLLRTPYLRVTNNQISDEVVVETKDLVRVKVRVSYRVNFTGEESSRWFEVENYVKLLTDHMRSKIRNTAKRTGIEDFYGRTVDIVRDTVLGAVPADGQRPGFTLPENNMHVYDVEILGVEIADATVAKLLHDAQTKALSLAVTTAQAENEFAFTKRAEGVKVELAVLKAVSAEAVAKARTTELEAALATAKRELENTRALDAETLTNQQAKAAGKKLLTDAELEEVKARNAVHLKQLQDELELTLREAVSETEQVERRAKAMGADISKALLTVSDNALMKEIAVALAPLAAVHGISAVDVLKKMFKDSPIAPALDALASRGSLELMK